MASHTKGRHEWNAVMKETYGVKVVNKYAERFKRTTRGGEKRQSSRVKKASKALLAMNAEERRGIEDERMNALEADNYRQEEADGDDSDFESDEDERPTKKRKGQRVRSQRGRSSKRTRSAQAKKVLPKKIPFALLLAEDEEFRQKYLRASTKEPNHPRTRYCPVTGQPAKYRDPATGTPYARIEAFEQIREKAPPVLLR